MSGDESEDTEWASDCSRGFEYRQQDEHLNSWNHQAPSRLRNGGVTFRVPPTPVVVYSPNNNNRNPNNNYFEDFETQNNLLIVHPPLPPLSRSCPENCFDSNNDNHNIVQGICNLALEQDPERPTSSSIRERLRGLCNRSLNPLAYIEPPSEYRSCTAKKEKSKNKITIIGPDKSLGKPSPSEYGIDDEQRLCDYFKSLSGVTLQKKLPSVREPTTNNNLNNSSSSYEENRSHVTCSSPIISSHNNNRNQMPLKSQRSLQAEFIQYPEDPDEPYRDSRVFFHFKAPEKYNENITTKSSSDDKEMSCESEFTESEDKSKEQLILPPLKSHEFYQVNEEPELNSQPPIYILKNSSDPNSPPIYLQQINPIVPFGQLSAGGDTLSQNNQSLNYSQLPSASITNFQQSQVTLQTTKMAAVSMYPSIEAFSSNSSLSTSSFGQSNCQFKNQEAQFIVGPPPHPPPWASNNILSSSQQFLNQQMTLNSKSLVDKGTQSDSHIEKSRHHHLISPRSNRKPWTVQEEKSPRNQSNFNIKDTRITITGTSSSETEELTVNVPRDNKRNLGTVESISSSNTTLVPVKSKPKSKIPKPSCPQKNKRQSPSQIEKYLYSEPFSTAWEDRFLPETEQIDIKTTSVEQAIDFLEEADWSRNFAGLTILIFHMRNNTEQVSEHFERIIPIVHTHLRSPKSKLLRQSIACLRELFLHLGSQFNDSQLNSIADRLFSKTADANKFIKEEVEGALQAMVRFCPASRIVQILDTVGKHHRNMTVRRVACRMTRVFVESVGADVCLAEYPDKILPLLCNHLNERAIEIREEAKEALKLLVILPEFDGLVRQFLCDKTLASVVDKLERIKDEALERTPRRRKTNKKMSISIEF